MKAFRALLNILLPSLVFFVIYKLGGIVPALVASAAFSLATIAVSAVRGKVKNTQVMGLLGLLGSAVMIGFTGEEKYYYLPSLIRNIVFLGFMLSLCLRHKSVLHYMAKDFEIKALQEVPESRLMAVNVVWIVFFSLKIIAKAVGMLYLEFQTLYWLVFLLGDPMTIVAIVLSVAIIKKTMARSGD